MARAPSKTANKKASEEQQDAVTVSPMTPEEENELIEALRNATESGSFLFVDAAYTASLVERGIVEVDMNEDARDEQGRRPTRYITPADVADSNKEVTAMNAPVQAKPKFEIQDNVPVPSTTGANRGRGELYPFEALQPGQSFFVPQVNGAPSSMSSTVAGARRRFAEPTGQMITNRNGKEVAEVRTVRDFTYALVEENGVTGFRVWRTV